MKRLNDAARDGIRSKPAAAAGVGNSRQVLRTSLIARSSPRLKAHGGYTVDWCKDACSEVAGHHNQQQSDASQMLDTRSAEDSSRLNQLTYGSARRDRNIKLEYRVRYSVVINK